MADDPAAALAAWREAEKAATPLPWKLEYELCECGGEQPCGHGKWPYAIVTPRPHTDRKPGEEHPRYDFTHSEVPDLGAADLEFIVTARTAMPLLLAAVEALTAALSRHQQWFIDGDGIKTCGGCLEPVPCPDSDVTGRALAGKDSSDE